MTDLCFNRNPNNRGFTCVLEPDHHDDHGVGRFPGAMRWDRDGNDATRRLGAVS